MDSPDYRAIEGLVRQILDQLRTSHVLIADGDFGARVRLSLREAIEAHEELTRRMNDDALDAHAAGHIFAELLGERINGLRDLANEMRGDDEPPPAQITPTAAILRSYTSRVEAD